MKRIVNKIIHGVDIKDVNPSSTIFASRDRLYFRLVNLGETHLVCLHTSVCVSIGMKERSELLSYLLTKGYSLFIGDELPSSMAEWILQEERKRREE